MMHSDRRVEHLQRIAHVCLAGPLDIFLGVRPAGSSRAFAWLCREAGRRGGTRSDGGGAVGSYPGVRSWLWSAAAKGRCRDYGADDQGSDHGGFFTDGPKLHYTELVAKALHRVEFRASQKGSQDKYLGVCAMALTVEKKGGIVAQFRRDTSDTGSPEVQVALLSERINGLGEHFTAHKRDHSSRRGLVKLVNQRRKLLDYLKSTQPQKYQELVERLGLRR